ncbi:MAG: FtsX-like permease family protein [candidate division NC10 bacterium]|nr:FtsX-like permease family protein [candidate division NC10 bacterium]
MDSDAISEAADRPSTNTESFLKGNIGIRRAIGATKRDILGQFLIETILIFSAGGTIGILLGCGMTKVITLYARWETGFTLASVFVAFGTSASIGLTFGLFPARRAAHLNPVQTLRFEGGKCRST